MRYPRPAILLIALFFPACAVAQQSITPGLRSAQNVTAAPTGSASISSLDQARALLDQNAPAQAEKVVRAYLTREPQSSEAHFLLGYILFREIQADAARTPQQLDQHAYLAMRDRQARASLAEYTEGAKHRDPTSIDLKVVSLDYVLLGDYADANKWLAASLSRNPSDAQSWYYLGRIRYKQAHYADAVQAFQHALSLSPGDAAAEDNLGLAYEGLGQEENAVAAYRTAIAWLQTHPAGNDGPWLNLGSLLLDGNHPEQALPILQQAVSIHPQDARAHESLAKTYQSLRNWPEAQVELETAVRLAPHAAHLHYLLGRAYQKNGSPEKARFEFSAASALNAQHTSAEDETLSP